MKKSNIPVHPPKWAERFLSWYCKPELLEDLQGDLNEYFERNLKTKGARSARWIYIIDVIKFLRLYTLRKPEFINALIHWIMLGSYIKTSSRSILRNKLFSSINIAGLAISMSVGLLLIGLLSDLFSYDAFHQNSDRIYRVTSHYSYLDQVNSATNASSSIRLGKAIEESIPGVDKVAVLRRGLYGDVKVPDAKAVTMEGLWANEASLQVFTFPLLHGNSTTALKEPFSVLLTEKSAKQLFGDNDATGKTVLIKDKEHTVTGVLKDVPLFSHIRFDMLVSLSTREITQKDNKHELEWDNMWNAYTYLLVPENTDLALLQSNLNELALREDKTVENTHIKLGLQPLKSIALGEELNNEIGPVMNSSVVWMIGILCIVVLLSACFNYTNLSIARSMKRAREIGVRKVSGALRSHVAFQFITEAIIISLAALAIAFMLFLLLRPYFISVYPGMQDMVSLELTPQMMVCFVALAAFVGLAAGVFPALFFSRINAIQVLKSTPALKLFGNLSMRRMLIVMQYTISIAFIAATTISYRQYEHMLSFDLGFDTENILNISLQENKPDQLIKALNEMPEVKQISKSGLVTSVGYYWSTTVKYTNPADSADIFYNQVDENYLPLHRHKFVAGKNFTSKLNAEGEKQVIVNEKFLKRFNITNNDPLKAIDEYIFIEGERTRIVGVLKDFHYGRVESKIMEAMFTYRPEQAEMLNVKIQSNDIAATMNKIQMEWKKLDDVHPLKAHFYEESIERTYDEYKAKIKIVGVLAFLAIFIASIGLLGMVVFTTETRLKELSIRKVMGASDGSLVVLLGKNFILLLSIAAVIALPATYFYYEKYVLNQITFHAPINISDLVIGVMVVMALALIMIGIQAFKAARSNPVDVLKNE